MYHIIYSVGNVLAVGDRGKEGDRGHFQERNLDGIGAVRGGASSSSPTPLIGGFWTSSG